MDARRYVRVRRDREITACGKVICRHALDIASLACIRRSLDPEGPFTVRTLLVDDGHLRIALRTELAVADPVTHTH